MIDTADLHTETFTNREGWTVVRVTHVPSGDVAERERTDDLASSVQAQAECIDELRGRMSATRPTVVPLRRVDADAPITRDDLNALSARVDVLEAALRALQEDAGR